MADPHFVVAVLDTSGNLVNAGDSANSLIRVSIVGGGGGGVTGSISAGTTKGTLGEVVFSNSPTVTFGMDGQTVTASAVGGAGGGAALSAGTQSVNTGTVVFANSNGITFGMSGSSQVTASYTVPSTAGLLSAVNVSAGTTSNNLSALTFANGGGVSFGLNASTVTATVRTDWLSTQSNQAFSAGAASSAFQTLVFNDANGVTWSNNAGSVQASYSQSTHSHSTAPGAIAAGTQTATSGTVVFANSNGISFGMSGSSQVTATYTVPSTAGLLSAVNVSAGTTSNNLSALTFNNGGGVSFGLNASTVTATVATTYRASNDAVGLNTAQSNVTWTVNSAGLSLDARGYAGTATTFNGANISGSMTLNSNGLNLSLSGGGGGVTNQTGPNIAAGGVTVTDGTVVFSNSIEQILATPGLQDWEYLLTIEHDNCPPVDGLVRLIKRMEEHPEFSCIGGLYWTKGFGGVPQIWGDPSDPVLNFRPMPPDPNGGLVECCGTGMGFNLWRLKMFKDPQLRKPWFKTVAGAEGVGTQDLYFWSDARKYGYRCAIDCSVKVGHYDLEGKFGPPDTMW